MLSPPSCMPVVPFTPPCVPVVPSSPPGSPGTPSSPTSYHDAAKSLVSSHTQGLTIKFKQAMPISGVLNATQTDLWPCGKWAYHLPAAQNLHRSNRSCQWYQKRYVGVCSQHKFLLTAPSMLMHIYHCSGSFKSWSCRSYLLPWNLTSQK